MDRDLREFPITTRPALARGGTRTRLGLGLSQVSEHWAFVRLGRPHTASSTSVFEDHLPFLPHCAYRFTAARFPLYRFPLDLFGTPLRATAYAEADAHVRHPPVSVSVPIALSTYAARTELAAIQTSTRQAGGTTPAPWSTS